MASNVISSKRALLQERIDRLKKAQEKLKTSVPQNESSTIRKVNIEREIAHSLNVCNQELNIRNDYFNLTEDSNIARSRAEFLKKSYADASKNEKINVVSEYRKILEEEKERDEKRSRLKNRYYLLRNANPDLYGNKNVEHPDIASPVLECRMDEIEDLATGSIDEKIKKIRSLVSKESTEEVEKELCKHLAEVGPTPEFEREDQRQRAALRQKLEDLMKTDLFKRAKMEWVSMSDAEKKQVAEQVLAAQRETFFPTISAPRAIEVGNENPSNGKIKNGSYNHGSEKIWLNSNSSSKFGRSLTSAIDVLTHEQAHRYQHIVAEQADKLDVGGPYYRQAQIWALNFKKYRAPANGHECYRNQSVERHSQTVGAEAALAV